MSFFWFARDERGLVLSEYLGLLGGIIAAGVAGAIVLSGSLGGVAGQTLGESDGSGGYLAQSGGPLLAVATAGDGAGPDDVAAGGATAGDAGGGSPGDSATGGPGTAGGSAPVATLIQRNAKGTRAQYEMPDGKKQWFDCTTASPCGETRPAT